MTISTLVFDFGNVVAFFSHRRAAEQLLTFTRGAGHPVEELEETLFRGSLACDYDTGRITTRTFIDIVCDRFGLECDDDQFARAFADIFEPNTDICDLLPRLKAHHRLVLLSNTNEMHARHYQKQLAPHLAHFDARVFSHEVGAMKPDPAIYETCRARAGGVPAAQFFFLDDMPENVEAARACGWQGLVYRPGAGLARQLAEAGIILNKDEG
jgi:FMN phosphatase YigB (HAD superfamily)